MSVNQNRPTLIHLHKGTAEVPKPSDLYFGEIAVNHSTNKPALYIKNDDGIVEFLPATTIAQIANTYADGLISALGVSAQTVACIASGGIITIYPTITEEDGKILVSGEPIQLSKVAKTGKAEDITIDDVNNNFSASTVEGALSEVISKMSQATTINGECGEFIIGEGLNNITKENKTFSIKTRPDDYVKVDTNGIQLDSDKIDKAYNTEVSGNLATVGTVQHAIENLDVNGFWMLDIIASAQNKTTLVVKGIKEVDGKIELDPAHNFAILVDGQYNNSTNRIATEQTVRNAISGLSEVYASKSDMDTLIGKDTDKSVRTIVDEELSIKLITSGAASSLDVLKEIAEWIQEHPADASYMNLQIVNLESSAHTHNNKELLDKISEKDIDNWNIASKNSHTHDNADVLSGITKERLSKWDKAGENAHKHENQELLDSYKQTEENLSAAVASAHSHANKEVLDGITESKVSTWDESAKKSHMHENSDALSGITKEKITNWDNAVESAHTHANKDVIDSITSGDIQTWNNTFDEAKKYADEKLESYLSVSSAETEFGKTVINASGDTYVSASVVNQVVQVNVTQKTQTVIDNSVLGVSSATSANVVVDDNRLLDFSHIIIDCGEY